MKILVMGLPGSGKTTFAGYLKTYLEKNSTIENMPWFCLGEKIVEKYVCQVDWFNADDIRKRFNDWDFSNEGRIRQSLRMFDFAMSSTGSYVICDFVAPLVEMRNNFKADWTVWMDTITSGRFDDTNKAFVPPDVYDFRITEMEAEKWAAFVGNHIICKMRRPVFDPKQETVQMLGRWQPWHKGHRALFERALAKTGQVVIQIRDCQGWGDNPFHAAQVKDFIRRDLDPLYQGQYTIQVVPNIVNITYGRNVGYKIEQEVFDEETHNISATKIRETMRTK